MAIKRSDAPPPRARVCPSSALAERLLPKTYSHEANSLRFRNARMYLAAERVVYLTS